MLIVRAGQFLSNLARHAVPIGGLFGRDWHPVTAMTVYWLESVLLALIASFLVLLLQRRVSDVSLEDARHDADDQRARRLEAERREVIRAKLNAGDVFGFHVFSLMGFGIFLGGVTFMLFENGQITDPMRWEELRQGAVAITMAAAAVFLFDLWSFDRMTPAVVKDRVDACVTRWVLMWLLGFFGAILIGVTGRAAVFFGFFAALKIACESSTRVARLVGRRTPPRSVYDGPQA